MGRTEPPPKPPFVGYDWDDELNLEDIPEAIRIKADGLASVALWMAAYATQRPLTLKAFTDIHRVLFEGLFPQFAGKLRGPAAGEVYRNVTFGQIHRGTHADQVRAECEALFGLVGQNIAALDEARKTKSPGEFRELVIQVAAYVHCEAVKIHPFVNGNGRTSRACIDYFAARYGFLAVVLPAYGADRDRYKDAMRTYVQGNGFRHLADYMRDYWQFDPAFWPHADDKQHDPTIG